MALNDKLSSGFFSRRIGKRKRDEDIAVSDHHTGHFRKLSAPRAPISRAVSAMSVALSLLFTLFNGVNAFAIETSDAPSVITPAEQAYSAYQKGDFETARALWRQMATRGDATAQYNLGLIYSEGRGVKRNPQIAIKWWLLAAENGHLQAQHNLALAYIAAESTLPGVAEKPRLDDALVWLRKSARRGLASSRYILGSLLLERAKTPEDKAEAIEFLAAAADQGHAEAQFHLGKRLFQGDGVEVNRREGLALFLKAAGSGHAPAQDRLAAMYQVGEFVPVDRVEALAWASLASTSGLVSAAERRAVLLDQLNTSEIEVAEVRARELSAQ